MSRFHGPPLTAEMIPMVVAAMNLIFCAKSIHLTDELGKEFDEDFRERVCNLTGVNCNCNNEKQEQDLNDALNFLLHARLQAWDHEIDPSGTWWPLLVTVTFYDGPDVPEPDRRRAEVCVNPHFLGSDKRFGFSPTNELLSCLQHCVAW